MELSPGTLVANRFQLSRKLGEGGMGAVWFAHHVGLDTPCAVKFIHPEVLATPGVKTRFEREAKAAAQIRSPHVVQVLDYGIWEGAPYIAMEYLDGEDLSHRLARQGRLSPRETVAVVAQIARALTKAHAAGLIHRDLKPENVFIVRDDDGEIVKVLDFGIAKSQTTTIDAHTRTGAILGTPHYMSPEQAQGTKTVDHRADLWSLGVIAYRSLVGTLPFQSDALGDLLMRIIVHPLPVPSQVAYDLPPTFDAWWARAAARDPASRYQTAKELAESLAAALGLSASLGAVSLPLGGGGTPLPLGTGDPSARGGQAPPIATPQPSYGSAAAPLQHPSYGSAAGPMPGGPPPFGAGAVPGGVGTPSHPGAAVAVSYPGAVPQETISPASHTFVDTPGARRPSSALFKVMVALSALVVGAGISIGVIKLMSRASEGGAVSADTSSGQPMTPPPPVAAPSASVAAGAPTVSPSPATEPTPPTSEPVATPQKAAPVHGGPRPHPLPTTAAATPTATATPTPTRTGRVVIPSPPP